MQTRSKYEWSGFFDEVGKLAEEGLYTCYIWGREKQNKIFDESFLKEGEKDENIKNYLSNNDTVEKIFFNPDFTKTKCEITSGALVNIMAGPAHADLDELKLSDLPEMNKQLQNTSPDEFNIMIFSIHGPRLSMPDMSRSSFYPGHQFVVVQYKNDNNETRYHLLQSYVDQYSLADFMANKSRPTDFDYDEFTLFVQELKDFLQTKVWTKATSDFHNKYFGRGEERFIGSEAKGEFSLNLQYGSSSLKKFDENVKAFREYESAESRLVPVHNNDLKNNQALFRKMVATRINWEKDELQLCYFEYPLTMKRLVFIEKSSLNNFLTAIGKKADEEKTPTKSFRI